MYISDLSSAWPSHHCVSLRFNAPSLLAHSKSLLAEQNHYQLILLRSKNLPHCLEFPIWPLLPPFNPHRILLSTWVTKPVAPLQGTRLVQGTAGCSGGRLQKAEADRLKSLMKGEGETFSYSSAYRVVDSDIISLRQLLACQTYVKIRILWNRICLKKQKGNLLP